MNYGKSAIILTFFSLWLTNYFSVSGQEFLAFFLIFSVGILHGSNDLSIINKMQSASRLKKVTVVLGLYVLVVLLAAISFLIMPEIALSFFILFSAYHFGEQHWEDTFDSINIRNARFLYVFYGLTLLFLLFYLNELETKEIVAMIIGSTLPSSVFTIGLFTSLSLLIVVLTICIWKKLITLTRLLFEVFLMGVFSIVFKVADLIWAFAIYFIFWHSIPSILGQLDYLYGVVNFKALKQYLISSSVIWIVSVGSILMVFYLFQDEDAYILPLFFGFLGAVTFAHSFIITRMIESKKAEN